MKKERAKALGYRLKMLRISRKMNQTDLAKKLDIPQSYVSDLESGKKMIPTDTLLEITEIFDIGLEYFDLRKPENLYSQEQNLNVFCDIERRLNALEEKTKKLEAKIK